MPVLQQADGTLYSVPKPLLDLLQTHIVPGRDSIVEFLQGQRQPPSPYQAVDAPRVAGNLGLGALEGLANYSVGDALMDLLTSAAGPVASFGRYGQKTRGIFGSFLPDDTKYLTSLGETKIASGAASYPIIKEYDKLAPNSRIPWIKKQIETNPDATQRSAVINFATQKEIGDSQRFRSFQDTTNFDEIAEAQYKDIRKRRQELLKLGIESSRKDRLDREVKYMDTSELDIYQQLQNRIEDIFK